MSKVPLAGSVSSRKVACARSVPPSTVLALAGASVAATVALSFAQPAQAQTFQSEMDNLANTVCGSLAPCPSE